MSIKAEWIEYGSRTGYFAAPARAKGPIPGVVVISEVMGVNAQIEDVVRRMAAAGYAALAHVVGKDMADFQRRWEAEMLKL